jgi:hypothetical protein
MRLIVRFIALLMIMVAPNLISRAQMTPEPKSDVSNKALITRETPSVKPASARPDTASIAALRKMADDFFSKFVARIDYAARRIEPVCATTWK